MKINKGLIEALKKAAEEPNCFWKKADYLFVHPKSPEIRFLKTHIGG